MNNNLKIVYKIPNSLKNKSSLNIVIFILSMIVFANSSITIQGLPSYLTTQIFHIPSVLLIFVLIFLNKGRVKLNIPSIISIITIIYLFATQIVVGGLFSDILASVRGISYYILAWILLKYQTKSQYFLICDWIFYYCFFLFGLDTLYRFSLSGFKLSFTMVELYKFKTESILFFDTNTMGVLCVILVFFAYYLFEITKNKKYLIFIFISIFLTILSISRAAIIAVILPLSCFFIHFLIKKLLKDKLLLYALPKIKINSITSLILLIIISVIGLFIAKKIIIGLMNDGSFLTKLDLLSDTLLFAKNVQLNDFLLGIGFSNAEIYTGRYAHAYIPTYVIETGLMGYFLVTTLLTSIFLHTKKTIYILFPFMVVGISFIAHYGLGLLYTALAFICYYEHYFKNKEVFYENSHC